MTGRWPRVSVHPVIDWAVASRTLAGEPASGDSHVVAPFPGGVLVAALDGLGHGRQAAQAARAAAEILASRPEASLISLLHDCHQALRETRGVVLSLASFNVQDATMTWTGVGNVEGVLIRADPSAKPLRESMLLRRGVVGYQLPQLAAAVVAVAPGDVLVFATDGIHPGFIDGLAPGLPLQSLADRILSLHAKGSDDALVLAVAYLGGHR